MDKENILKICNNNSNTLMETLGIVFIDLGDENARMNQYGDSLVALKDVFTTDDDRYKVVKNLAYIARADDFIHENEMAMVEQAVSALDMVDKVKLVKTDSTLFVDPTF